MLYLQSYTYFISLKRIFTILQFLLNFYIYTDLIFYWFRLKGLRNGNELTKNFKYEKRVKFKFRWKRRKN